MNSGFRYSRLFLWFCPKIWTLFYFKIQLNNIKLFNIIPMLSFCHMPNILGQKGIIFFGQDFAIPTIINELKSILKEHICCHTPFCSHKTFSWIFVLYIERLTRSDYECLNAGAWKQECFFRKNCNLKFTYSEKATIFCEISTVDLSYVLTVKSTVKTILWPSQNIWTLQIHTNSISGPKFKLFSTLWENEWWSGLRPS